MIGDFLGVPPGSERVQRSDVSVGQSKEPSSRPVKLRIGFEVDDTGGLGLRLVHHSGSYEGTSECTHVHVRLNDGLLRTYVFYFAPGRKVT